MSRASNQALDALHALIADVLMSQLQAKGEDGKSVPPSPQLLAQAIKFLKDNGVDAPARSERISNLEDALKGFDLDLDEVAVRPN